MKHVKVESRCNLYLSASPQKTQAHNLLQRQPPLQSQRCNRLSLLPKRLKTIDVSIHLSCHFSIWTKHKRTVESKLEVLIYMQDQYLSVTSDVNLSLTLSHNIKILFKCDIWSDHKVGSLRWEKGALLICYRINKYSKPLWKIDKLTFTKIWPVLEATLKSKQPFTLSYILSPPLQPCQIPRLIWLG